MDYYEKKYKEAFEKAREIHKKDFKAMWLENLFPELKESEDERIRKELIEWMEGFPDTIWKGHYKKDVIAWLEKQGTEPNWCHHKVDLSNCSEEYRKAYYDGWNNCNMQHSQCESEKSDVLKCLINGMKFYYEDNKEATWGTEKFSMKVKDILSWLERQDEQNPTDKVEPKFHEGEWITNGACVIQITSVDGAFYWHDNNCVGGDIESMDKEYHLWTIQDAKAGDVLIYKDEISLYKHDIKNCTKQEVTFGGFVYYCCYDGKRFIMDSLYSLTEQDKIDIHPATKEQRDLLFSKMKEAEYEWDEEKKELRKIEQKPVECKLDSKIQGVISEHNIIFEQIVERYRNSNPFKTLIANLQNWWNNTRRHLNVINEQKPEWSEKDEKELEQLIDVLHANGYVSFDNWLKSIKERVQPKPEWSEEGRERA